MRRSGGRRGVSLSLKTSDHYEPNESCQTNIENVPSVPEFRPRVPSAVAAIGSSVCHFVRRAASPRHVWHAIRGLLPLGAPLVAPPLPGAVTHVRSSNKVMGWRENYYNELD